MYTSNKIRIRGKRIKTDRDLIFYCGLFVFPVLQFLVFYIAVNINSFSLAFKSYDVLADSYVLAGWNNFSRVWKELTDTSLLLVAVKNSVTVWFFSTVFGTVFAILFSYYIYKKRFLGKTFRFTLFLPTILPAILLVIMFKFFANEAIPVVWKELTGDKINPILNIPVVRFVMIVFYTIWIGFGAQVLLYNGTMEQISPSVTEAAEIDGASPFKEFIHIVMPEVLPTIGTFLIAGVATIFTNQANLYSFYGNNVQPEDYTIGYYMFYLVNNGDFGILEYPYASALGLCCTAVALPLTFGMRKLLKKVEGD